MADERMRILEMISDGTITAEQAARLIAALDESGAEATLPVEIEPADEAAAAFLMFETFDDPGPAAAEDSFDPESEPGPAAETVSPPRRSTESGAGPTFKAPPDFGRWRAFWYLPLAAGVLVTALSGLLLFAGIRADWHWFWMSCVWLPLLLGILVIVLAWGGRTARWLHVRVNTGQDEWPRRIAISLPLPLRTSAWAFRIFGRFIPGLDDIPVPVDEAILALQHSLSPDDPLYIQVDERGGEKVEVYIG